jgi:hypothetical protein
VVYGRTPSPPCRKGTLHNADPAGYARGQRSAHSGFRYCQLLRMMQQEPCADDLGSRSREHQHRSREQLVTKRTHSPSSETALSPSSTRLYKAFHRDPILTLKLANTFEVFQQLFNNQSSTSHRPPQVPKYMVLPRLGSSSQAHHTPPLVLHALFFGPIPQSAPLP